MMEAMMPRQPTDRASYNKNMDKIVFSTLIAIAQAGEKCPTDTSIGEGGGWSKSQVARSMIRLCDARKISVELRGNKRVVTLLDLGISTEPFLKAKPVDERVKANLASIPDNAAQAMTVLRRRGIVCYGERVSDTSTRVTGWYHVRGQYMTLAELLALAEKMGEKK